MSTTTTSLTRALVLLGLAAVVLSGCSPAKRTGDRPNVVIITMDTVRADHLHCYDYGRETTPHIDAFARDATLYRRAVATAPWTVPTHASLFTGKFPFEHGAHAFKVDKDAENNTNPLTTSQLTLAEVFWDEGYTTGAFVANDAYLGPRWQLNQGFEVYQVSRVYSPELNEKVFGWLETARKRPFFLFVNYIDAHSPYNTKREPGLDGVYAVDDEGELVDSLYNVVMPATGEVPPVLVRQVIDQYDTAVRNLDEQVGALFDRLKLLGVYDNTIIVLTSDHGEYFGEHYLVEHSKDVYEEAVAVPLVIKNATQKNGSVVETMVSLADVPDMIISQFEGENWKGHLAAFPAVPGTHEIISEIYYTRVKDLFDPRWGFRFDRVRTAIYDWPYKYIFSSDGKHELFNLEADQGESSNLLESEPGVAARLDKRLSEFMTSRQHSDEIVEQPPLSDEERKRLKSLGYIGD